MSKATGKAAITDLELYKGILEDYKDLSPEEDRQFRYEVWRRYCWTRKEIERLKRSVEILSMRVEERLDHDEERIDSSIE